MAGLLKPKIFNCPSCGANLEINALGYSSSIACKKCQSIIDVSHPLPSLIKKYNSALSFTPSIPIGSFGFLRGNKWKVIGFIVRKDLTYAVEWNEYLLYNPYLGFRFLIEIDSHFSLAETLNFDPTSSVDTQLVIPSRFSIDKIGEFKLFNHGRAEVIFALGEFYWQVKIGEKVEIDDCICPPYMVSREKNFIEVTYSLCEYINHEEIVEAFKNTEGLILNVPWKPSANAPNPYHKSFDNIMKIFGVSFCILLISAMAISTLKPTKLVAGFQLQDADFINTQKEFVSPSFDLNDDFGNVEIRLSSPVNNHWLSSDIVLVNETTGEEYKNELGVEYYWGSDSDGSWTEGSQYASDIISAVPEGHYHAEVSADSDMGAKILRLDLFRNSSMWGNLIFSLMGISIYPCWVLMRRRSYEVSRWDDSDYSPYRGPGTLSSFTESGKDILKGNYDD